MPYMGRYQQPVASSQSTFCSVFPCDPGTALQNSNPFVLRLNVLVRSNHRRTDDSFDDEIFVAQQDVEALAIKRRYRAGK